MFDLDLKKWGKLLKCKFKSIFISGAGPQDEPLDVDEDERLAFRAQAVGFRIPQIGSTKIELKSRNSEENVKSK